MASFFEIGNDVEIGYKQLSAADLGLGNSHQTHIGLFESTFKFLNQKPFSTPAKLIYEKTVQELLCLVDFIRNPNGTYRSPKIREGQRHS